MKYRFFVLLIIITTFVSLNACNKTESTENNSSVNESLIGTFTAPAGSTFSPIYINSEDEVVIPYFLDECNWEAYNYNVTKNVKTDEDITKMSSPSDTNLNGMNAEISLRGTKVIITDTATKKIINEIPTGLNSQSEPDYGMGFVWDSSIKIDTYGDYIYMVNENGISRAKYDDREFTYIIKSSENVYFDISNYESFLPEEYPLNEGLIFDIYVVNEDKIIISACVDGNNHIDSRNDVGYFVYFIEYSF